MFEGNHMTADLRLRDLERDIARSRAAGAPKLPVAALSRATTAAILLLAGGVAGYFLA